MTAVALIAAGTNAAAGTLDDVGEMSTRAHAIVLVATLVCVVFILRLVRRYGLRSKYSLIWLLLAVMLVALGVFPGLLVSASRLVGIHYPPAAFLALAVGVLFLIVIHFSWELSRLEERTRILSETAALIGAELDTLRSAIDALDEPDRRTGGTDEPDHSRR